jgi:hypothetical protein
MVGYDDFLCMIIWYEEHLNVNMCILEICMVLVYEITECECIDWWPFDVAGGATEIRLLTERGHPTGGAGRWSSPLSVFMLNLYNAFYTYCYYSNMVVWDYSWYNWLNNVISFG